MNDFGFIDYLRPIGPKTDYRTSSYVGHVYYNDTVPRNAAKQSINLPNENQNAKDTPLVSEQMEEYPMKNPDYCVLRNPPLKQRYTNYMKAYEEARLRSAPKLIQEPRSIYKSDFRHEEPFTPEKLPEYNIASAVKNTLKTEVDPTKPGYARLLDSNSTSQRIDFPRYSTEQQLGIVGAKEYITFWNWIKKDHGKRNVRVYREDMCEHRNRCLARRNEFMTQCKPVPHYGLTTESRSNYKPPVRSSRDELTLDLKQSLNCMPMRFQRHTENKIYGSGERLDKYINTQAHRRHVLVKH